MKDDDAISISSDGSEDEYSQRRAILEPPIRNVVDALGGYEGGVYRMGDEAYGCLKDLKKYWRKDDTDDERTVARIFWSTRVLPNDLVPILLETAGKGYVDDKRAIACADLVTAMTWPIDLAEELKELDDELDRGTDYTQLLQSHLHYKAALLRPGVLQALFSIMLPCLAKEVKERKERDVQIVNVVLHLVRNLAFIKDLPANVHLSADQAEFSNLQSKLIRTLSDTHFLDLILTIASNAATDTMFNGWNTLTLEIFYLLFRGITPNSLVLEQTMHKKKELRDLLSIEGQRRRDFARNAPSRHSRFGTTISVKLNPKKAAPVEPSEGEDAPPPAAPGPGPSSSSQPLVLHRQQALTKDSGVIIDLLKRQKKQKGKKEDELSRVENLSTEARTVLQGLARTFIESCFNRSPDLTHAAFLASLLKDIRSERPKITEKDNLRLLFVTKWFLQFFLAARATQADAAWGFGLVGEVVERAWIVWVLKRMRGAVEEKPKLWTELQAGSECMTQLLALIDAMAAGAPDARKAAALLQQQLVYNGQVLDAALEGLRLYRPGTQALAFLDAGVHLAYALMKMLERWGKARGEDAYVRKRAKPRRKRRGAGGGADDEGVPDVEEEEAAPPEEDVIEETMFTFEGFELKFANAEITRALLTYLARYKEFTSPESMKRVVSLMHRQAVKAKAEGLYFQVTTLELFKSILADQKSFPKEQPYKDLLALIKYILRQFFKAVEEDSFVLIEAFFPKTRGQWKKLSSWEPEAKGKRGKASVEGARFPPDVQVKKGYSWSEQLAIAMAALQEAEQGELIEWVKDILSLVIAQRERIIAQTDGAASDAEVAEVELDEDVVKAEDAIKTADAIKATHAEKQPSAEALAQMTDYLIPYISDEQADAATKNPQLKLMFRLVHFYVQDEDAEELEWYIPAGILVADLQRSLNVIRQFQIAPLDLGGKRAAQLLSKKRRRARRARSPSSASSDEGEADYEDGDNGGGGSKRPGRSGKAKDKKRKTKKTKSKAREDGSGSESDEAPRARKVRKQKETVVYKSAQFIEDSDEEYGADIDAFFAREAALRERAALAAADSALGIGTMRATGTKKRVRRAAGARGAKRRRTEEAPGAGAGGGGSGDIELAGDEVGPPSPATAPGASGRRKGRVASSSEEDG
ncbi:timeless-domain-containing protein [Artomyces pyxidatus]|uniref:Timeless-domain-containing protein n=1 Tax=Artomyces pyxidatus TaxID=48021 RepID=A0ACB8SZD0_9AGAM|nr:timeless-domain-containing protein [Artomyces pyxidatus]